MTEEKLIEMLTEKYVMTVEGDLYIYWEDAIAMLHEALAAQRGGCAETWLTNTFGDDIDERRKVSAGYQNILNAEPLEETAENNQEGKR